MGASIFAVMVLYLLELYCITELELAQSEVEKAIKSKGYRPDGAVLEDDRGTALRHTPTLPPGVAGEGDRPSAPDL